jgi:hypothetical protein
VATGTEILASRATGLVFVQKFIGLTSPHVGYMAQIAQKRLYFTYGTAADENQVTDVYIDIAACLTAVNRKQYHQCTASGDPLCYTVTVSNLKSAKPLEFCTAPNTWTTRNAAKKTAVGWKAQLKHAGIRLSELPTYARRFRCAYEYGAHSAGANQQSLSNHLVPDGCDGKRLFTTYDAPDGTAVTYATSNEIVMVSVAEDADPTQAYRMSLLGDTNAGNTSFGMIYEYLKSRRNMREETDMTTEFPDADGLMNTLFAVSEELADDVVGAVDDFNISRPYTETDASLPMKAAYTVSDTTNFQETFNAPLGLIKITGGFAPTDADAFFIDVEAVYEM